MSLGSDIGLEAFRRGGGLVGMTARLLGTRRIVGRAVKGLFGLFKGKARPGIGSAVTKGPLKVGKQIVYGKAGMSTAAKVAIGAGVAGVVAGSRVLTVPSHVTPGVSSPSRAVSTSHATAPASSPQPQRASNRQCCPPGTKRMVCYKRGKVKKESRATARARTAREKVRARAKAAKAKAKERAQRKRDRANVKRTRKALKRLNRRR